MTREQLDAEYAEVLTRKKQSYREYRKGKDEVRDYLTAQKIIEAMFGEERRQALILRGLGIVVSPAGSVGAKRSPLATSTPTSIRSALVPLVPACESCIRLCLPLSLLKNQENGTLLDFRHL